MNLESKKLSNDDDDDFEYIVYARPHLQMFLDFIFQNDNFNVLYGQRQVKIMHYLL